MILIGFGNGLGAGSAFALSKYIGENNKKKADNASVHAIFIMVVVSIIISIILLSTLSISERSLCKSITSPALSDFYSIEYYNFFALLLSIDKYTCNNALQQQKNSIVDYIL